MDDRTIRARLLELREALTGGDCAACGDSIPQARLQADPATPFCRECAEARQG